MSVEKPKFKMNKTSLMNLLLIGAVIFLAIIPLITIKHAEFSGADSKAQDTIHELEPNYKLWTKPFWQPPSKEIESLLFSIQAGIGAGFIGYYLGYLNGQRKKTGK